MSCSFISAFRELSNLSCGAVANIDHFSELNKYLHVIRTPEKALRDLLSRIENLPQKRLVLVCGSAGDGKSHLLSYFKNEAHLLEDYMVYSDATESDAPNKTAISTLAKRIEAFNDENIDNGGAEKIIIAINLGMLNNFIDSEEGQAFSKLRQYVINNNIFTVLKPYHLPYNPLALTMPRVFKPLLPIHVANAFNDTLSRVYHLGPKQSSSLLNCIKDAYAQKGISPADSSTWSLTAPTFHDVFRIYMDNENIKKNDSLGVFMNQETIKLFDNIIEQMAYIKSLSDLNEEIFQLSVMIKTKQDELVNVEAQYQIAEKRLGEAYKNLELDIKRKSVTSISSKAIVLLEELQAKIHGKLTKEVRADTLSALRLLIRKKSFIEDLEIDDNFKVHLLKNQIIEIKDIIKIHNRSGIEGVKRSLQKYGYESLCKTVNAPKDSKDLTQYLNSYSKPTVKVLMEISIDSLSKGEKQIFVMSLYWAMMKQSKCQLPFIIDTPFARIDTEHRTNIVDHFFKRLPGQLLILSTNEEINAKHMQAMSDSISNSFMLEFGEDKRTRIAENRYFEV